ncbi:DUF1192 family protein [Lacibacterium aquatile]|uniref:DUF1192 family protein n=1 Tax=Lacibacterium aquatile TaxID=1168082 RepID=A0ABW5DSF1_9PROT
MVWDAEDKPTPKPLKLDMLGVEELRAFIADRQAEIALAEAEIQKKQAHRTGAEALFKR